MSKQIWIVLAVIILLIVGFLVYNYTKTTPIPAEPTVTTVMPTSTQEQTGTSAAIPEATIIVNYTDSGFSPKSIIVKLGGTVTFVNNSSKMMWIASAPHPVHTDYPGFDEKVGVGKGESYSFTFNKPGTHKYHNHLNPTDFGTVVVE